MSRLATSFWNDENGGIISAEFLLVGTILIIALCVGLAAVRDAINLELADLASAIAHLDQSYSVGGIANANASCSGQMFTDLLDEGDDPGIVQPANANSRCVILGIPVQGEQ